MPTPPASVITIDCHYDHPERAAAFLILEGDRAAFVDNNTTLAVPHLLAALAERGYTPEQVDYAIVTHIHLDHAGGTAELVKHCPNATVLAHPRAARHLIDPSRIVAGATAVYGAETFAKRYGVIEPVAESRVRIMEDGETLAWGGRTLTFIHTKGHASHHFCIHDSGANALFAGDAFGLSRMTSMRPGPAFTVCTSSPPEFDPVEARISVQRIMDCGADWVYQTHFGYFSDLETRAEQLLRSIGDLEEIGRDAAATTLSGDELQAYCQPRVVAAFEAHLKWCGVADVDADMAWLAEDIRLNAMGLGFYAERLRLGV
jgi:glyoxylase-like metal-dependent hydrolase (beta-lactamase superfamily II)